MVQKWGIVEASFLQEYNIHLDRELTTLHAHKFLTLLGGLTQRSALGQWLTNEYLEKQPRRLGALGSKAAHYKFNPRNKNSVNMLEQLLKSVSRKGE